MNGAPAPGEVVGRYEVVAPLGEGGMGSVCEARRVDLPLRVALKTVLPALRARPDVVKRFLREAEALARMRHPHVVDVLDFGVDDAHGPWLAMRLLDGESLARRIERGGAMAPAAALAWALPVAAGLRHAHALGVVHRDLKPDNVFLARSADGHESPVVIDFGASRYDGGAPLTASGVMIGTPLYMAPEQFWGASAATARSDQYALAFALYESLAGSPPFQADGLMEVIQRAQAGGFEALAARAPSVPAGLSDAVMRALAVDPTRRFDDLAAFARALLPFADPAERARWSSAFGADVDPAAPAPPEAAPAAPAPTAPALVVAPPVATPTPAAPPEPAAPATLAPPPRRGWWLAVGAVGAVGAGLALARGGAAPPAAAPVARPPVEAPPVEAPPVAPAAPPPVAPAAPRADASVFAVDAVGHRPAASRPSRRPHDPPPRAAPPPVAPAEGPRGVNGAPIRY